MKNIYLKYILLSVALTSSLLFTACGNKSETINEAPETTAVEETTEDVIVEEPVEESDKAMNPDYNNPEEYAAEDYYDTEETIAESSGIKEVTNPGTYKSDLDVIKENLDGFLERGVITQEEYDEWWAEEVAIHGLADENGMVSDTDVMNYFAEQQEQQSQSDQDPVSQGKLPDYAVITHGDEGLGANGSTELNRDPRLAGIRSN